MFFDDIFQWIILFWAIGFAEKRISKKEKILETFLSDLLLQLRSPAKPAPKLQQPQRPDQYERTAK